MDGEHVSSKRVILIIVFTLPERQGALGIKEVLSQLEGIDIIIQHVESKPSKENPGQEFTFLLQCECFLNIKPQLEIKLKSVGATSITIKDHDWFPKYRKDLDVFTNNVLEAGRELKNDDHPGFHDEVYKKRRRYFADLAINYRHGQPIPRVEYTAEEIDTWRTVFNKLTELYPTHACKQHNDVFPELMKECGYSPDNIPQLDDISRFLQARSGFQLRPVAGLLSPRDFLAGLALRVFHSTQYIRHRSKPFFTPEPDVCHELLGHVPMLSDPTFAEFSQEIGLASLGAPDDCIKQLSTLYWFTIEFGLCKQDGKPRAYGASLLSSFGELQYCLSDEPEVRPLDAKRAASTDYTITEYQEIYYLAESFMDAKEQTLEFAKTIPRPFTIRYNPHTETVEEISSKEGEQTLDSDNN